MGNSVSYSLPIVCGFFFYIPHSHEYERLWNSAYSLSSLFEKTSILSLTIYICHYKGCTFSAVIWRPWMLLRSRFLNPWPPTQSPDTQPAKQTSQRAKLRFYAVANMISLQLPSERAGKYWRHEWNYGGVLKMTTVKKIHPNLYHNYWKKGGRITLDRKSVV